MKIHLAILLFFVMIYLGFLFSHWNFVKTARVFVIASICYGLGAIIFIAMPGFEKNFIQTYSPVGVATANEINLLRS